MNAPVPPPPPPTSSQPSQPSRWNRPIHGSTWVVILLAALLGVLAWSFANPRLNVPVISPWSAPSRAGRGRMGVRFGESPRGATKRPSARVTAPLYQERHSVRVGSRRDHEPALAHPRDEPIQLVLRLDLVEQDAPQVIGLEYG
jgi:hypothetical protein